jgi:hypothetical protein
LWWFSVQGRDNARGLKSLFKSLFGAQTCFCVRALMKCILAGLCFLASLIIDPALAAEWQPISPDDLHMTSEPKAPGAPAIVLYRQVDRNDHDSVESVYVRIKILTEEGRKYADIEIPFAKESEHITDVQGRTIRPDGSIANFDGKPYDKQLVSRHGSKVVATTFALPDAQVGSIIEYRYRNYMQRGYVFDSHWILSLPLFTRYAKFSLVKYEYLSLRVSWPMGMPPGTPATPNLKSDVTRLEVHDVPAFAVEEYMPPENQLKYRVDFIYSSDTNPPNDPAGYWKLFNKTRLKRVDSFLDEPRAMREALAQIVQPGDSPEIKLHKIYARTQKIHNITFERRKTDDELKREDRKENKNVQDVWQRGYGTGEEITWLFVALARAADIPADPVLISTRDQYFFAEGVMNESQLNTNAAIVSLNGKELYLDPGYAFAPYGVLPWFETAVRGMKLNKQGGEWISTPPPRPTDSRVEHGAEFQLDSSGTLKGKVSVTYSGLEALWRRVEERNEDDTDRKQFLEDQLKAEVPVGITVELTNRPDWDSSDTTLVAEFDVEIPGWAASAGKRALLNMGVFGAAQKGVFTHVQREQPLYFDFPTQQIDEVAIALPKNLRATNLPPPRIVDASVIQYILTVDADAGTLHIKRQLTSDMVLVASKFYPKIREVFQAVRDGDETQITLVAQGK